MLNKSIIRKPYLVGVFLAIALVLALCYPQGAQYILNFFPKAYALDTSGKMTWGTPLTVEQYIVVGEDKEIAVGNYAYVFNQQAGYSEIPADKWAKLRAGDLSSIRQQIEHDIPGSEAVWIAIYWDKAEYFERPGLIEKEYYRVEGFKIEAVVQNKGAALTGAEIVLILITIAFVAVVITLIVLASWVTWEIIEATKQIGPGVTVAVGLLILILVFFLLMIIFGGSFAYKGKTREITAGKKSIFRLRRKAI
jgi:hypothetical protein